MAIDPPRPACEVLDTVSPRRLVLEIVVETHLHNDRVSSGPELVEVTGATYVCRDLRARGTMRG
jgi:hydroxyacylglutathione hydrolase